MNQPAAFPDHDQERIALQNEARRLELELETCQRELARLRSELETAQLSRAELADELAAAQQEALFQQAAGPVSQLVTQAYLLEKAGKNLQARDVLAVARRLVNALQNAGLAIEGQPGEQVRYDPDRHLPVSAGIELEPGQRVIIRFAGIRYQGKILQRAGVDPAEETA